MIKEVKTLPIMIQEVKMFTVICDCCGKDANEKSEYSCWNDESCAEEQAMLSDWLKDEGKHYCPDCFSYDDEDNLIIKNSKKKENIFQYIKRWNWKTFFVIILLCLIGALGNKNMKSFSDCIRLVLYIGVPIAILLAWLTKDEVKR